MFGLELWFVFAVAGALVGGFGAFSNKIAAARQYDTKLVMFTNSVTSIAIYGPLALWFEGTSALSWLLVGVSLTAGLIASASQYIKIQVLHYIDSAIFLPLFKVLGPMIVIVFGVVLFGESFTMMEWFGLLVSLSVPLLLVSRVEHTRQNNLKLGLILVGVCAVTSAIAGVLQKYATDIAAVPLWITVVVGFAILCVVLVQLFLQRGSSMTSQLGELHAGIWQVGMVRTIFAGGGFYLTLLAYTYGGPLGIVYTINSLYILLPIVLAIIFYGEHWNYRKALAILLSVVALALLQ